MKEQIGQTAGAIWDALRQNERLALGRIPKVIKTKESLTYQAIGWLARENKIEYQVEGNRTFVRLADVERGDIESL